MKYIERIVLKNFQSHKYTEVEFDNQLNIIVGPSDSGKTAIIRGLKWCLYNEPLGDFFIRKGETECSVEITLSDGMKVMRYRSPSKNLYKITDTKGESQQFEGFGHGVPVEVQDVTSIRPIPLDQDNAQKINLGEQLEGAFLLSESGSVKASSIGRLVGANLIDDALRESLSDSRRLKQEENSVKKRLEDIDEEIKSYDYLKAYEEDLNRLKECRSKIKEKKLKYNKLNNLNEAYRKLAKDKKTQESILKNLSKLDSLESILEKLGFRMEKKNTYGYKLKQVKMVKTSIEVQEKTLLSLKGIAKANEYLDIAEKKNKIYKSMKNMNNKYKDNIKDINKMKVLLEGLKDIDKSMKVKEKLVKDMERYRLYIKYNINYKKMLKNLKVGKEYTSKFMDIGRSVGLSIKIEENLKRMVKLDAVKREKDLLSENKKDLEKNIKSIDEGIKNTLNDYGEVLSKQETCPLCFSHINDMRIKDILKNYEEEFKI